MSGVEGWIEWHGGENPVPGLVVQVQWRDQSARYTPDDESCSDEWKWGHHDMYCDIIAYRVVTPAALSAIEGGGGALQPSASVPTEQADGGVVGWQQWGWRVRAKADAKRSPGPWSWQPDPLTPNTTDWAEQEAVYVAPPATPIAGGFGSRPQEAVVPTERPEWPVVYALTDVATLADRLINGGGLVNRGVDRGLVVVENKDRSDPHYQLCVALETLAKVRADVLAKRAEAAARRDDGAGQ